MTSNDVSRLAKFISRRLHELAPARSQAEIATAAGFKSVNMLSMIKDGKAKLPLDRVEAMANALEVDPRALTRLALEQFYSASVVNIILDAGTGDVPASVAFSALATAIGLRVESGMAREELNRAVELSFTLQQRLERLSAYVETSTAALNALMDEIKPFVSP